MASVCSRYFTLFILIVSASRAWSQTPATAGSGAAAKPDPARVVISVGDQKITVADLDSLIQSLPPQYRTYYSGAGKHLLPRYIVQMKILSSEALKQKLDQAPPVQRMLETARESILADAARSKIEEALPVSDQAVEQLYEKHKPEFEEAHIRRILIRTQASILTETERPTRPPLSEADARKKLEDIRQKILAGADFQQMARENSDDTASARSGGDLGYVGRQTLVPPIADAAFSLGSDQISDVIPTPYGMELIKVEGRRTRPLEEVRSTLTTQLRQAQFQEAFKRLENEYKVVVDENYFSAGPTKSTAPAR